MSISSYSLQSRTNLESHETIGTRYFEKKQDDLYFVLERFSKVNATFWNIFANKQNKEASKLFNSSQDKTLRLIISGTIGFSDSLKCHQIFARKIPHELWILFASRELPKEGLCPDVESLEMTCTVSTAPESPFTTHMGIFRTINSNLKNDKIHRGISIALHAFGAKVMRDLYPEKIYMITTPMPSMEVIFKRALGEHHIHIGLREDWVLDLEKEQMTLQSSEEQRELTEKKIDYYKNRIAACSPSQVIFVGRDNSSFTLRDLNGNKILCLNETEMDESYGWFFRKETTFSPYNNIVAIPLPILSEDEFK